MERAPLRSTTSRWLGDFAFFQYIRLPLIYLDSWGLKKIMKKASLVLAIAFGLVFLAQSQTSGGQTKKSQLDGAWELVAGQQLPKAARNIKIISGGHFIFAAYDTKKGNCLVQEVEHTF